MSVSSRAAGVTVPVGTFSTAITSGRSARKGLIVQNVGSADLYVGDVNVTTANGFKIAAGGSFPLNNYNGRLYGVAVTGTIDVRFMEMY